MYTKDLQGTDGRAYQNGIRSHFNGLDLLLLLFCFGWFVWFYLCPWAIYTLVIAHPSSVWYGLHLVEWSLSYIRHWLVIPQALCYHCLNIFQAEHRCRSQGLWLGWCFCCSFGSVQSAILYQRLQTVGMKAPVQLLHVQWVVQVLSSARGPCCEFVESDLEPITMPMAWVAWGFSWDPLTNNSIRSNPILKDLFSDKKWPVGALSSLLTGDFI